MAKLLKRDPGLAGLYSIGAGNRSIQAALAASGRAERVVWVCHELTAHARRLKVWPMRSSTKTQAMRCASHAASRWRGFLANGCCPTRSAFTSTSS